MTKQTPNDLAQHAAAQQRQKAQPNIVEEITREIQRVMGVQGFEVHEPAKAAIAAVFDWLGEVSYGPMARYDTENINVFLKDARKESLGDEK